jgi:hypothetical protein
MCELEIREETSPSIMVEKEFRYLQIGDWFVFEDMDFIKSDLNEAESEDSGSSIYLDASEVVKVELR